MGKNNAYGGPAPRVRGSVVVSMRRLNRVLEVNEELAYAVVEPGVSFFDLCAELQRRGSALWASIPDLGWGSVIGNTVDHGVGYLPGGNHAESMCGMEVVLASGEVIRTGMGAMAGNQAWHAHRRGFGPAVDSLFMQSNFGIVTKMGKWLTPRPEVYAPVEVRAASESDLEALIDTMRPLLLDGTVTNVPLLGTLTGAASMTKPRAQWHSGAGPAAAGVLRGGQGRARPRLLEPAAWPCTARRRSSTRSWRGSGTRSPAGVPGAEVAARKIAGDDVSEQTVTTHPERVQAGIPGLAPARQPPVVGRHRRPPGLLPGRAAAGAHARRLVDHAPPEIERAGLDFWPGTIMTPRSFYMVSPLLYDTTNEAQVKAAYDVYRRLVRLTGEAGYGLYRGHIEFMDDIAAQYDWGDHAMLRLYGTLKDALDPDGILSPGKQGIWPSAMRES